MENVSRHGSLRARKRTGINKKSVERIAARVYQEGKRIYETKGRLYMYLESIKKKSGEESELRLYGNNLYIFKDCCLVTVWALPGRLSVN